MNEIRIVVGASFLKRFLAHVIDNTPGAIVIILGWAQGVEYMDTAILFLSWPYFALMESSSYQGTIGKRLLRMKVTDMGGNRIGFGRATGRYFGKCLSSLLFCLGFVIALFTKKNQALHDLMAKTLVLDDGFLNMIKSSQQRGRGYGSPEADSPSPHR